MIVRLLVGVCLLPLSLQLPPKKSLEVEENTIKRLGSRKLTDLNDDYFEISDRSKRMPRDTRETLTENNPKSNYEIISHINTYESQDDNSGSIEVNKEPQLDKLNFDFNFDRLKRNAQPETNNPKEQVEIADLNVSKDVSHNDGHRAMMGRMLLQDDNVVPEGSREPRGATKEQWIKQPYPVHASNSPEGPYKEGVHPSSSSDVRAPRVHFVTQKRAEQPPSLVYKTYEREGRGRDFQESGKESSQKAAPASRKQPPHQEHDFYAERPERPFRSYEPYRPAFNPYRDDPYFRYEESRYDPQYVPDNYDHYHRPSSEFVGSRRRQRRIIYYATLPEVVRTPPNVNLRDKFNYRDNYDDRYPLLSDIDSGPYRFERAHPFFKSRYDYEIERSRSVPYPLKVSTDLSVREAKKNPERRIYSEPAESRYAYQSPSYHADSYEQHP